MIKRTCLGVLFLFLAAIIQADTFEDNKKLFDYDSAAALDVQELSSFHRDGVTVHDITYVSPKQGRVTAYLVVPDGKGPFAAILFGHWGNGKRTEFLSEAINDARAGAVSLLIDYPWARPAPWYRSSDNMAEPQKELDVYVQAVVDLRRGADLLLARKDVDPKRLAYVGHSYGAQWGAILSAVDRRFKTLVLIGGVAQTEDLFNTDSAGMKEFLSTFSKEKLDAYLKTVGVIDAIHYVSHAAPAPLLLQFARFEQYFNMDSMEKYIKAASDPKTVKWYDTGHEINDPQALTDRTDWLQKQIGISPR